MWNTVQSGVTLPADIWYISPVRTMGHRQSPRRHRARSHLIALKSAWIAIFALFFPAVADAQPSNLRISVNPQIPLYRDTPTGQVIDAMITFTSAASAGPGRPEMRM